MAGPTLPRSGRRRPMGVYAPPHLREEYLVEAQKQNAGGKDAAGKVVHNGSRELENPRNELSSSEWEQSKSRDPGHRPEQVANLRALNDGKTEGAQTICQSESTTAPVNALFLLTSRRFERESASEDWLHWLERLISSVHIQMDAVVALYLDGLLRMETGEGPEEKKAGLSEFVDAMLPAESEDGDLSQPVMGFSSEKEGINKQKLARSQKITWLIDNVWGAWQEWGADFSKQPQSEVFEENDRTVDNFEDFETWLNARMWALGLDLEVCVPYVTGLLEMDEGGTAIAEFLADAALQEATATLDFDPVGTTDEILARYRQQRSISQSVLRPERLEVAGHSVENGSQKTKRKAKKKALPVDLFSHWWSSELGQDWGTTASDDDRGASPEEDSWKRDLWDEIDNMGAGVSKQSVESWGFDAGALQNGGDRSSRRSAKDTQASNNMSSKVGLETSSGARYQGSPGKPPTSVIVARRMILHVLGLKDPNRRRHF